MPDDRTRLSAGGSVSAQHRPTKSTLVAHRHCRWWVRSVIERFSVEVAQGLQAWRRLKFPWWYRRSVVLAGVAASSLVRSVIRRFWLGVEEKRQRAAPTHQKRGWRRSVSAQRRPTKSEGGGEASARSADPPSQPRPWRSHDAEKPSVVRLRFVAMHRRMSDCLPERAKTSQS